MVTSQELQVLVQELCSATGRRRRNLEAKLAVQIPNLKGLARVNNHLYVDAYNELLNDVIFEVLQTVCTEFDPNQSSLATWINEIKRLKYRVLDLYPPSEKDKSHSHTPEEDPTLPSNPKRDYEKFIKRSFNTPDSLNRPMGKAGRQDTSPSLEDVLADPTLSDLDARLEDDQNALAEANRSPVQQLIAYLKTDPHHILRNRVPVDKDGQKCPACNDHEVTKFLYLEPLEAERQLSEAELHGKITALAEAHNINFQTLYSRIKSPNRPGTIQNFILGFGLEFGLISDQLKTAIESDPDQLLSNCAVKNHPACHCLFLAQRRLPLFTDTPLPFDDIANEVNSTYGYRLNIRQIRNHWQTYCYPRLGQLAATLGYKPFSNAGVES